MNEAPLRRFASAVRTSTSRSGLVRGSLAASTSALVADSSATVASSRSSSFCTTTSCGSSARTASASCVGQRLHLGQRSARSLGVDVDDARVQRLAEPHLAEHGAAAGVELRDAARGRRTARGRRAAAAPPMKSAS